MIRWEYKVASFVTDSAKANWDNKELEGLSLQDGLRELGYKGWELVSFSPLNIANLTNPTVFVFKRPRN